MDGFVRSEPLRRHQLAWVVGLLLAVIVGVQGLSPVRIASAATLVEAKNVPYDTDPQQLMDVRWLDNAVDAPLIVIIHGGWSGLKKGGFADIAVQLTEAGFVTAVPDFRDYGDPDHPAQLRDVRTAIKYLKAHTDEYPFDPARIGALGNSLGGWVAGIMAAQTVLQPKAVVTWSGLFDPYSYPEPGVGERLFGCPYLECDTQWEVGTPLTLVNPGNSPWLLAQSPDEKVPLDQGERMDAALEANGVDHEFVVMPPGAGHGKNFSDLILPATVDWFWSYL
jgi:acetyl esterase/lipase